MGLSPLRAKPESLTQMVYGAIWDAIVDKTLMPGSPVSEAGLARDLRVSKTPVRDALLRLQSIGLVEPDRGRSMRIVLPSRETILQAYEMRSILESAAARLAAQRASAEQRVQLFSLAEETVVSARAGNTGAFRQCDWDFHRAVSACAQNARLEELANNALALTSVLRARDVPLAGDSVECAREHVLIVEAIDRQDAPSAALLAGEHVDKVGALVLSVADSLLPDRPASSSQHQVQLSTAG